MNRRSFLTALALSPLAPALLCEKFGPSKQDESFAKLTEISDYGTCSGPFIQFKGIWYFSDQNIIKWCPKSELRSDNWRTVSLGSYEDFDFWQHDKDKLYWCGRHERWGVDSEPFGFDITLRFEGYFDEA